MRSIKLYYGPGKVLTSGFNFGDSIAPFLMEEVTGRTYEWASIVDCEAIAIGSLIQRLTGRQLRRALKGNWKPLHVFGSGFIKPRKRPDLKLNMIFHAVRGPISRDRLRLAKETVLGDPGILFDRLVERSSRPRHRVGIIPHYVDRNNAIITELNKQIPNSVIIEIRDHPLEVLKQINDCEVILSSSLHGLIAADCYGKPNFRIASEEQPAGGGYKFIDHWLSVGRQVEGNDFLAGFDIEERLCESHDAGRFDYFEQMDELKAALENALRSGAEQIV